MLLFSLRAKLNSGDKYFQVPLKLCSSKLFSSYDASTFPDSLGSTSRISSRASTLASLKSPNLNLFSFAENKIFYILRSLWQTSFYLIASFASSNYLNISIASYSFHGFLCYFLCNNISLKLH